MARLIDAEQFGVVSLQGKSEDFIEGVMFVLDKIDEAPTVEERQHGKWIDEKESRMYDGLYNSICSVCKDIIITPSYDYNFCPNCGADMREGEAE